MQELIHAHATHHEGGVLPGLLVHLNLPEPTLQIHTREVSGAHHAFHHEGGVLPGLLVHLNLPEPTLQIHKREVSGAHHAFHGFLHTWQGIGVLFGPGVQATKVDTEPKRPILFSHEHHSIAPG